jgi:tetratricopeptide (TPR) repeat protein
MLERSKTRWLAWTVLSGLMLSACALANKNLTKETSVEARKSLETGDFEKALESFKTALKKNPRGKDLTANYIRTVEDIKRMADGARSQKDYAQAGGIYGTLLDHYGDFGAFAADLSFTKAQLAVAVNECRAAMVDNPAAQAVKTGNFPQAIDIYRAALRENPKDAGLAAKYGETVETIKAIGDKAFGAKDFARAGKVSAFLLENFASFDGLKPPIAFTRQSLTKTVTDCRENLTTAGLAEYRKGNLTEAIAVWVELLSFDPDNAEIRKAVNTAKTQLDAIKKKK